MRYLHRLSRSDFKGYRRLVVTRHLYCQRLLQRRGQTVDLMNTSFLQVLGTGHGDTWPSLGVFTPTTRIVFNCGENMQRVLTEYHLGIRLASKPHFFFTSSSWCNMAGLPGAALSLERFMSERLSISGSVAVEDALRSLVVCGLNFMNQPLMPEGQAYQPGVEPPQFIADGIVVTPAVVSGMMTSETPTQSTSEETEEEPCPPFKKRRCPANVGKNFVIVYHCQMRDIPGKFDVQKAINLGIPKGKKFKELQDGKTIVLEDGRKVEPYEVVGSPVSGPAFLVVECPDQQFVQSLAEACSRWEGGNEKARLMLIVHLTPHHVVMSGKYQAWMGRFGDTTEHLVVNKTVCSCPIVQLAGAELLCRLNIIDRNFFPMPYSSYDVPAAAKDLPPRCIPGDFLSRYFLYDLPSRVKRNEPRIGFDTSQVNKPMVMTEIREKVQQLPGLQDVLKTLNGTEEGSGSDGVDITEGDVSRNSTVVFLGTGSASPGQHRNCSGILLEVRDKWILMDCGEGTLGQMFRRFGLQLDHMLCQLRLVFISHIHGDHHFGFTNILLERKEAFQRQGLPEVPLVVLAPRSMDYFLQCLDQSIGLPTHRFFDLPGIEMAGRLADDVLQSTGLELSSLSVVPVIHTVPAWGVVATLADGFKIVYSGDTRPCSALAKAGAGAHLLIHEATFEDLLDEEANSRRHSTINDAMDVAVRMQAKFVILTHFSQRYSKLPLIDSVEHAVPAGFAFDLMTVPLTRLHRLPVFIPALNIVFKEEVDKLKARRHK